MIDAEKSAAQTENRRAGEERLPPAWREFIRYCRELRHGEIERLCIQDGVPVLAEVTKQKIRFNGQS
jgi:hypothetical protein